MRPDTLARMLLKAAVTPGTRALVCETCAGLVYGAVAERLGPQGTVVCASASPRASTSRPAHAAHFARPLATFVLATIKPAMDALAANFQTVFASDYSDEAGLGTPADSLLVVSRFDPIDVALALLPHLRLGGSFTVYCAQIRPLEQLAEIVMGTLACNVELTEDWFREFQVKPTATHPEMAMNGAPGFVLSGSRVLPGEREMRIALAAYERVRPSAPTVAPAQAPAPTTGEAEVTVPAAEIIAAEDGDVEEEEPQDKKQKTAE